MEMSAPAVAAVPPLAADRWTRYSVTVLAICIFGFAFDIYEATIMQLATPLLIKEWGIAPATIGNITTLSRWAGLIGLFVFPALADVYGRKPILVMTILGYSLFTGLVRTGVSESPRFERVTAAMVREGLRQRLDIWSPVRAYPREMLVATTLYFLYLFTWIGWSAWMPQFLANEKHLGFQTMGRYLSVWMGVAIFAYWICGWLCDRFGRRHIIPAFVIPASILLVVLGRLDDPASLFWVGLAANFLITGSFGAGLGYNVELFPTQIRGTAVGAAFCIGSGVASISPAIMGWIATSYSIAAGLPLLALSFFLIGPLFYFARETTRAELADFVGQR